MKKLLLIAALSMPFAATTSCGCKTVPAQTQAVQTLKAVGYTGKAVIDGTWELRKQGVITEEKWARIALFYDERFQPAFRAAVRFAKSNVEAPAPIEIVSLLSELQTLAK
jgi:uncharacterized lipoprotein YmbA